MPTTKNIQWQVQGMSCTNCALSIEKYMKAQNAPNVNVDFATAQLTFDWDGSTELSDLKRGINQLGFTVNEADTATEKRRLGLNFFEWKLAICLLFTLPLLLGMIPVLKALHQPFVQFLLSLPVMIIGLYYFGGKAINSLKMGILSMDVLIVIGATAAFVYSTAGWLLNLGSHYLFFETGASIITVVLIGNYIEHRSITKTTTAIRALLTLQPQTAKKVIDNHNNKWEETAISQLQIGDEVLVGTGDKIPADGMVEWGKGTSDESMLTGESQLVEKSPNSQVFAGTLLSQGSVRVQVQQLPENSSLQQIINLVKKAQTQKPPIQRFSDKISAIFIPLILAIAAFCFVANYYWWGLALSQSVMRSIAVLVVACPCAMGLATPIAVMVGLGKLSKLGMLVKGGSTIQQLGKIKNMVFDKTGTLTTGEFTIENAYTGIEQNQFKAIVKSLEQHSSHPLAKSILQKLTHVEPFPLEDIREIKGLGIVGKDEHGNTYTIGSYQLAKEAVSTNEHQIYVLKNKQLIGWIDMHDTVKPKVKNGLQALEQSGINLYLLSGDKHEKTELIAKELGIENYYADKLPDEKLKIIEQISASGKTAMVGDGINDSPALAKADLGISLSTASDVAIQTASVVMLNNNFDNLSRAIKVGKGTTRTIKQNLFWAFFYNILMVPLAFFGLLHPIFAAIAMALSDIFIIGNTIRFKNQPLD